MRLIEDPMTHDVETVEGVEKGHRKQTTLWSDSDIAQMLCWAKSVPLGMVEYAGVHAVVDAFTKRHFDRRRCNREVRWIVVTNVS